MITILLASQTLAAFPNSRLKTPIVPGPQTSWVISTSTLTHTFSPAVTCTLPLARANSFSVKVILPLILPDRVPFDNNLCAIGLIRDNQIHRDRSDRLWHGQFTECRKGARARGRRGADRPRPRSAGNCGGHGAAWRRGV